MDQLIQTHNRLLSELVPSYDRMFYSEFVMKNRLLGIVGGRGVGKTTFLIHHIRSMYDRSEKALYVSADNLYFNENTLIDLADQFVKIHEGELLCIDEIHKYNNWNQELKNIYDSYPKLNVIFSGSSSVDLVHGKYDLSRRAIIKTLHGFSFREYLEIKTKKSFDLLEIDDLVSGSKYLHSLSEIPRVIGYLKDYWKMGYYPSFTEIDDYETFKSTLIGMIDKVIFEDVSNFYSLKTQNLDVLRKILYFYATSSPGSININKLAKSLKKDHATISEYVQMLRDTGVLRFLLNDKKGHALVRNSEKIYVDNVNLYYAVNHAIGKVPDIGSLRELFAISSLENAGYNVFYSEKGDIVCEGQVFEIGGKDKSNKQIKEVSDSYLIKDDILHFSSKSIPLYAFGFLS